MFYAHFAGTDSVFKSVRNVLGGPASPVWIRNGSHVVWSSQPLQLHLVVMYPTAIGATVPGNLECGGPIEVVHVLIYVPNPDIFRRGRQIAIPICKIFTPSRVGFLTPGPVQQNNLAQVVPGFLIGWVSLRLGSHDYQQPLRSIRVSCGGCVSILQHQVQKPGPSQNRGQHNYDRPHRLRYVTH